MDMVSRMCGRVYLSSYNFDINRVVKNNKQVQLFENHYTRIKCARTKCCHKLITHIIPKVEW